MGRRQSDSSFGRFALLILFVIGAISCYAAYLCFSIVFRPSSVESLGFTIGDGLKKKNRGGGREEEGCCEGVEHMELWGDAVKWGSNFKVNSSKDCCLACKGMCDDGHCLCNSWVFCGDKHACGSHFGECWLKRQIDILDPAIRDSGDHVMWTSGLVFGKEKGIIQLETEYGVMRIKLLPDCAPRSVASIIEMLRLRHCVGCHFYRAESRGKSWDSEGNHVQHYSYGPPFALIQGTLGSVGTTFKDLPTEFCPGIKRGSVAWVGSGPEFFISLANHDEWQKVYAVFGYLLPEDMEVAEIIAQLPTKREVWSNIDVDVLENPVPLRLGRMKNVTGS
ncbi:hypothetical protein K2173_024972 [Erythroxylum novogranatense]|uniref:PPIase cyclophilin-type domain-containing protein n=1 Tax=Erythroxylum novogranatense TaxID=1862640 RepID=A0AAV8UGB6_9ROSI|nr:hypothetical protein K2173_024972 [Erythroxylum novogranatense]